MVPPIVTQGETVTPIVSTSHKYTGKHVVIRLDAMTLELRDGTTTLSVVPVLSQGKPGSYYETIGGVHANDYKTPLHFSSIGYVYMPHSVHVYGNYFIHGIPYYPDGTPVASTYSGGCIRLTNTDAKAVYDFIDKGTPIIITRGTEFDFMPTRAASSTLERDDMTTFMVAVVSLEALTQDNKIVGTKGEVTTRRTLISQLLTQKNESVATLYAHSIGEKRFVALMNQKAQALGLSNTRFTDVTSPVSTTYEDYERFMGYIATYKSYLTTNTDGL